MSVTKKPVDFVEMFLNKQPIMVKDYTAAEIKDIDLRRKEFCVRISFMSSKGVPVECWVSRDGRWKEKTPFFIPLASRPEVKKLVIKPAKLVVTPPKNYNETVNVFLLGKAGKKGALVFTGTAYPTMDIAKTNKKDKHEIYAVQAVKVTPV